MLGQLLCKLGLHKIGDWRNDYACVRCGHSDRVYDSSPSRFPAKHSIRGTRLRSEIERDTDADEESYACRESARIRCRELQELSFAEQSTVP